MIHDKLSSALRLLGFDRVEEAFQYESRHGNWVYLTFNEPGPIVNPYPSRLTWIFVASSESGPASNLERASLTLAIESCSAAGVNLQIRKAWNCAVLMNRGLSMPGKVSMLAELISGCPMPIAASSFNPICDLLNLKA